jgi:hypothetical protein
MRLEVVSRAQTKSLSLVKIETARSLFGLAWRPPTLTTITRLRISSLHMQAFAKDNL